MSELLLVKRNNEYRVQPKDINHEGMEIISSMDIPMDMVRSLMKRMTKKDTGYFYISCPGIDDTKARYMFKDVVSSLLGMNKG